MLTIDVGNSRIKLGLFDDVAAAGELPRCLRWAAVAIDAPLPWDEVRSWAEGPVTGIVSGANPRGIAKVLATWPAELGPSPRMLENRQEFPLAIRVDEPRKVGVDRLLAAVAANVVRPVGRAAIIVSSGTATTVDYVAADGAFEGGAILPGFDLCARALHHYTALLPLLSIDELAREPHPPLGRNTRAAIRSGLFWGQLGAIKELIARLSVAENVRGSAPLLLLTGGGARLLAPELPEARLEPHLALQGIVLAAAAATSQDVPNTRT